MTTSSLAYRRAKAAAAHDADPWYAGLSEWMGLGVEITPQRIAELREEYITNVAAAYLDIERQFGWLRGTGAVPFWDLPAADQPKRSSRRRDKTSTTTTSTTADAAPPPFRVLEGGLLLR